MKVLILIITKLIYFIGKIFGKGSSVPGKIALKLDKSILRKIILPGNIIMVTGSNGKTSTTEMIYNVLTGAGFNVGCNIEGSNQIEGVTTMILKNSNISGVVKKEVLVIEVDERYLKMVVEYIKPKYLVITNLYRDQMTRNGHPEHIYNLINESLTQDIHLVLNADDPLVSMLGFKRDNVTYFGINKNDLSRSENNSKYDDGKYCPNCKHKMTYEYYHFNHVGSYKCDNCGYERKDPNYAVTYLDLESGVITINKKHRISMTLHSIYHAYNVLATFAVGRIFGIDEDIIVSKLTEYILKNDRVQSFILNGHKATLLTSKHENSISYDQSLMYVSNQKTDSTVVIIIDAVSRKYYTSETSWIWDIDFELLNNESVKRIILAGKYANDLAIRFEYSEIPMDKVIIKTSIDEMMKEVKENSIGDIYVITCFSDRMKFLDRR